MGLVANARSRLRSARTKLAAAYWAFCAFERQGHLVGTATGPPSRRTSQGSSLSILTEPHDERATLHSITSSPLFAERNVMECRRDDDGLFRLDVGRPDHLAPFLGFVGDELSKVGGRARQPTSARRALILGSVRPALISLLSMLTIAAGVRRTRPPHRAQSHGRGLCGGSKPVVHRKGHRAASFNTSGFRFSARTGA